MNFQFSFSDILGVKQGIDNFFLNIEKAKQSQFWEKFQFYWVCLMLLECSKTATEPFLVISPSTFFLANNKCKIFYGSFKTDYTNKWALNGTLASTVHSYLYFSSISITHLTQSMIKVLLLVSLTTYLTFNYTFCVLSWDFK